MSLHIPRSRTTRVLKSLITAAAAVSTAGLAASAHAGTLCVNANARHGCYATISAAVSAASAGDVIQVAPGIYNEEVTITKAVSLMGASGLNAIIDATNLPHGIWVNGMAAAPNAGVSNVLISGLKVRNANFEGILLTNATDVTVEGNEIVNNDRSLDASGGTCPGLDAFETSEGADCGEGVHLMGVDHSSILRNEVDHNSGGILISDETGPTDHNLISENFVHDNSFDCGITLASHAPATTVIPTAKLSFGVVDNTISLNASYRNGTQTPGAGVGIFAPSPGTTASGNVVLYNDLQDNGATGVAMHNHAAPPAPAPPVNFNDNAIIGNHFSGNGADNPGAPTAGPTGINVFSAGPIMGTVISQNTFDNESIDVSFTAPAGQLNVHFNDFSRGIGIQNLGTGMIDATENWWSCGAGPGGSHCSSAKGSGLSSTPWLTNPFVPSENSGGRH